MTYPDRTPSRASIKPLADDARDDTPVCVQVCTPSGTRTLVVPRWALARLLASPPSRLSATLPLSPGCGEG